MDRIRILPGGWSTSVYLIQLQFAIRWHSALAQYGASSTPLHDLYLVSTPHTVWPASFKHWSLYSQSTFFHLILQGDKPYFQIDRFTIEQLQSQLDCIDWQQNCQLFALSISERVVMTKGVGTIFVGTRAQIAHWDTMATNCEHSSPFSQEEGYLLRDPSHGEIDFLEYLNRHTNWCTYCVRVVKPFELALSQSTCSLRRFEAYIQRYSYSNTISSWALLRWELRSE